MYIIDEEVSSGNVVHENKRGKMSVLLTLSLPPLIKADTV